jgi:hypothetical protein
MSKLTICNKEGDFCSQSNVGTYSPGSDFECDELLVYSCSNILATRRFVSEPDGKQHARMPATTGV